MSHRHHVDGGTADQAAATAGRGAHPNRTTGGRVQRSKYRARSLAVITAISLIVAASCGGDDDDDDVEGSAPSGSEVITEDTAEASPDTDAPTEETEPPATEPSDTETTEGTEPPTTDGGGAEGFEPGPGERHL